MLEAKDTGFTGSLLGFMVMDEALNFSQPWE